jgi:nucleotide-binding universal stress UspA family protein
MISRSKQLFSIIPFCPRRLSEIYLNATSCWKIYVKLCRIGAIYSLTGREPMFEKILYPTDFSDVAKNALDFIKTLEDADKKEVIVLHVMDANMMDFSSRYAPELFLTIEEKIKENITKDLSKIEISLAERGFTVHIRLERGVPFREILRVEQEEDVSVIVIGSHGVSNVKEMLLGSVSEKVIRKAKKPVLVIKR